MREPDTDTTGAQRDPHFARLLEAAARGDARAFEEFYNATVRFAMSVVRRIVGDSHMEDVLSESYFQAWRNAKQFDPARGSALSWLLTMARSRALDRIRQETVRHGGLTGAPLHEADEIEATDSPGPEALLESIETSSRLHTALRELSASERWVLGLAYFRDHSHSEIAAITGLPLGTVKSHISRAQQKLRSSLEGGVQQQ